MASAAASASATRGSIEVEPRALVRVSILVCFGAIALAVAAWLLAFGLTTGPGGGASPLAPLVLLGGLVVLGAAVLLFGSAGADALWARLRRQP